MQADTLYLMKIMKKAAWRGWIHCLSWLRRHRAYPG